MEIKFVFFDTAKNMGTAEWSFILGNLLTMVCGMRLFIRTVQFLEGPKPWNPWKRPSDPIMGFILDIKLRNTLAVELAGVAIGIPAMLYLLLNLPK